MAKELTHRQDSLDFNWLWTAVIMPIGAGAWMLLQFIFKRKDLQQKREDEERSRFERFYAEERKRLQGQIAALNKMVIDLKDEQVLIVKGYTEKIGRYQQQVSELQSDLAERDRRILGLSSQLEALNRDVTRLSKDKGRG